MSAACSFGLLGPGTVKVRIRSGRKLRSSALKSANVGTLGLECTRRGMRFLPECPRDLQSIDVPPSLNHVSERLAGLPQ